MRIQKFYKKCIMERFMSDEQLKQFQEKYDEAKVPTVNNLSANAARDDIIRQIIREELKKTEDKKKFWL